MNKINVKRTGYKGFNVREDGTLYCRNMTFEVGKVAKVKGKPVICQNGIHFCWNLNDVHGYYNLANSVICEVEPLGEVVAGDDGTKCCTNELKIIRLLTKEEVLRISNTGSDNTGFVNTGNRNTGNCNTGNWNTGNWNTGDWNTGDWNTGNRNTGNCNTGDWNTGNWNTGNWNTGNWNTGFFNQGTHPCYIFDAPSYMTPDEFRNSVYARALYSETIVLTEWVYYSEEEKANDKAKELIGGYLKRYDWKDACEKWWERLTDGNKKIIQNMPNFDADKFKNITGIDVTKGE